MNDSFIFYRWCIWLLLNCLVVLWLFMIISWIKLVSKFHIITITILHKMSYFFRNCYLLYIYIYYRFIENCWLFVNDYRVNVNLPILLNKKERRKSVISWWRNLKPFINLYTTDLTLHLFGHGFQTKIKIYKK